VRIALVGGGKMGRAIAALAGERGHTVTVTLGSPGNEDGRGISRDALDNPDVVLEFTEPMSAAANVRACVRAGIPVVAGTTGWYDELDAVTREIRENGGALFWAANFSLGVAALSTAIEAVAGALRDVPGFQMHLTETHHAAKKDKPSGTAAFLTDVGERVLRRQIPITSIRVGHVPGTHELVIDGQFEQLRLVHEARDRRVFADGALAAAEWLVGRTGGGVFTMSDMMRSEGEAR
jgi:4-hydroxy-tetrahydrodipicolinate reductase